MTDGTRDTTPREHLMLDLTDSTDQEHDATALRARLREQGYLLLRGILKPRDVHDVRADMFDTLNHAGWLAPGSSIDAPRPSELAQPEASTKEYFVWYSLLQSLQSFHELALDARLVALVERVLDGPVLVHPRKIARASLPSDDEAVPTPPHQDYRLIQGSTDTLTCWLPFGACPPELGGLRVLEGSATAGLRPARPAPGAGAIEVDDDGLEAHPGWRTSHLEAGDVLLFHSFTVHGALPNSTDTLRLSADYRYQRLDEPVLDRSLLPHYSPDVPDYDVLTRDWTDTRAIDAPPGLMTTTMLDPLAPQLEAPASRLLTAVR